ncbi:MAG: hypothetical protein ABI844_18000 [Saprospiraceae bacterium]
MNKLFALLILTSLVFNPFGEVYNLLNKKLVKSEWQEKKPNSEKEDHNEEEISKDQFFYISLLFNTTSISIVKIIASSDCTIYSIGYIKRWIDPPDLL